MKTVKIKDKDLISLGESEEGKSDFYMKGKSFLNGSETKQLLISMKKQALQQFASSDHEQSYKSPQKFRGATTQNIFTIKDTRYKEITSLKSKNKQLFKKVINLEEDLKQIDEFRIALNLEHDETNSRQQDRTLVFRSLEFQRKNESRTIEQPLHSSVDPIQDSAENVHYNQKRVDILKSQVQKQQRYIRRLTTIVQSTRKFYDEIKQFLKYFTQVLSTQNIGNNLQQMDPSDIIYNQAIVQREVLQVAEKIKEKIEIQQTQVLEDSFDLKEKGSNKLTKIATQKDLMETIDKKQQYVSLKNLLQMFKSNEEKDNFINSFTVAYKKVTDYERQNIEFAQLFDINYPGGLRKMKNSLENQSLTDAKILFRHPIRQFLKVYSQYFPIRTVFNSFPMKEKEKLEHFLLTLEGISSQLGSNLKKIDAFQLFKSNPFYFRSDTESRTEKLTQRLELPFKLIEERELIERYLVEPEKYRTINLDHKNLHELEKDLTVLLDQLFVMQKEYQDDALKPKFLQDPNFRKVSSHLTKCLENLVCLSSLVGQDNLHRLNKTQIVMEGLQSMKSSVYKHPPREAEPFPKELAYVYSFQMQTQTSFEQQFSFLESMIGDFTANVNRDDNQYLLLKKAQMSMKSLKNIFDTQTMISQIKECQIEFLKSKMEMLEVDIDVFRTFMNSVQNQIYQFFDHIDGKVNNLYQAYNNIFDAGKFDDVKVRKGFMMTFRRTMKDTCEWVKKYKDMEYRDNVINLQQLHYEFSQKVNFFYVKSESLSRKIQDRSKLSEKG